MGKEITRNVLVEQGGIFPTIEQPVSVKILPTIVEKLLVVSLLFLSAINE
jgi:hypothetical protein